MRFRALISSCVFLLASLPAAASSPDPFTGLAFRSIGPSAAGGRVTAVVGLADDPKTYYLGAAGGGIWKTSNGGATWTPLWDGQPVQSIGAIAIAPSDHKIVWVGTGEANPRNDVMAGDGVYVSRDGGRTWKNAGLRATRHIASVLIDPTNPDRVLVGALGDPFSDSQDRGVYLTTNGGKTWTKTLYAGLSSGVSDMVMDPHDPRVVFAGIWQFRRRPWTFDSGGPHDGLYRSKDGGATWSRVSGHGFPTGELGRIGLAIAPSDSRRVYALVQSSGGFLWRSDDGGADWTRTSANTLIDQRPFYFSHIAVDPTNPSKIWSVSELISVSADGGKTFKKIPASDGLHPDNHAIWIAPNDPKRVMIGDDGGYILTLDGGGTWAFSRSLAIGQAYHVAVDDQTPYDICAGFQDNGALCGPSNSLDPDGVLNGKWTFELGGDGMWSVPDPSDNDFIWSDYQNGALSVMNRRTEQSYDASPYEGDLYAFDLAARAYRFNWFAPIAFAPWDPHIAWLGGNVIFQSGDRGFTWQIISPDLTRNVKSHQQVPGGAITHDVTGAEYADTVIWIAGSPAARDEIWAGTDDGLVQLTRDGGKQWTDVTPRGIGPWGYVTCIAPSPFEAGTAYAAIDRHLSGDTSPYLFKTTDFGASWTPVVRGLPQSQWMKTVLLDPVNPDIVYAGMERSLWISFDRGGSWRPLQLNLPASSVRDLRIQSAADDLVVATHGRALWVLDDLRPLQQWPAARAAGAYLFAPQTAYEYSYLEHQNHLYAEPSSDNPPAGALITFYQKEKSRAGAPSIEIIDANGRVVRTIAGTHRVGGKQTPWIPNAAGMTRVTWDFTENGPTKWLASAPSFQAPDEGATVVPGDYTVRLHLGTSVYAAPLTVKPDPRAPWTQDDYEQQYAYAKFAFEQFDTIDRWLNDIDATRTKLDHAISAGSMSSAEAAAARSVLASGARLESTLSTDPRNDEDIFIQAPGLREKLFDLFLPLGGSQPLPPAYALKDRLSAEMAAAAVEYAAWKKSVTSLHIN